MAKIKVKGVKASIGCFVLIVLLLIGEARCIYKMVTCNWEPIGKAEIVYTVGTFTGLGCVIGWMDIQDK